MNLDQLAEHYRLCGESLRESDRDRWLACLFAPDAARPHLFALYAFNAEVARIRDQVSQPILGEMRLQWWIDALNAADAGATAGQFRSHPTADALLATIDRFGLPEKALLDYLEARRFDLYDDPAPDQAFLELYCDETCGALFGLASQILGAGGAEEAARHAGRAYALAGLLRALPWQVARGQCFLPGDLLARRGLTAADLFAREKSAGLMVALAELRALARDNLVKAKQAVLSLPKPGREAFRLLALPGLYLRQMERRDYDPFTTPVDAAPWRRQWALWRNKV